MGPISVFPKIVENFDDEQSIKQLHLSNLQFVLSNLQFCLSNLQNVVKS